MGAKLLLRTENRRSLYLTEQAAPENRVQAGTFANAWLMALHPAKHSIRIAK